MAVEGERTVVRGVHPRVIRQFPQRGLRQLLGPGRRSGHPQTNLTQDPGRQARLVDGTQDPTGGEAPLQNRRRQGFVDRLVQVHPQTWVMAMQVGDHLGRSQPHGITDHSNMGRARQLPAQVLHSPLTGGEAFQSLLGHGQKVGPCCRQRRPGSGPHEQTMSDPSF